MSMRALAAWLVVLPLVAAAEAAPPIEPPAAAPPPVADQTAAAPAPAAQPAAPARAITPPDGRERGPWYIGFGFGTGSGKEAYRETGSFDVSAIMSSPTSTFFDFKVGATLTPHLLLGLDVTCLRTAGVYFGRGAYDQVIQILNSDAMLTWFPVERFYFLRGGLGLSSFQWKNYNSWEYASGVNVDLGAGMAFWLGRSFNLTVNLDYSVQRYGSSKEWVPSRSSFIAIWLGFDWY